MLAFTEPPRAESGQTYTSLEARCQACEVHGSEERPCVSRERMMVEEAETGWPCPYRPPATIDDDAVLRLTTMAWNPQIGHLWRAGFDVAFEARRPGLRLHRMNMIFAALSDARIVGRLKALHADQAAPKGKSN